VPSPRARWILSVPLCATLCRALAKGMDVVEGAVLCCAVLCCAALCCAALKPSLLTIVPRMRTDDGGGWVGGWVLVM
jgi:hypothetical protein